RAAGANPQRPLWASTGVKNPEYSPTRYVDELVVRGTVNTMPDDTMDTVESEARITGDTVSGTKQQAETVFENLSAVGVDLDDVYRVLEDEGVQKFEKSWKELLRSEERRVGKGGEQGGHGGGGTREEESGGSERREQ